MALRLSASAISVCSRSILFRRLCSGREFTSILSDRTVASPFADPSRTREILRQAAIENNALPPSAPAQERFPVEEPKIVTPLHVVETTKLTSTDTPVKPVSAIEELSMLKDSLNKIEQSSSSGGSGSGGDGHEFDAHAESEKRRKRMERNTRIGGIVVLGGSIVGFISFCFYYGMAKRDDAGNVIKDEHSGKLLAPFYRIYESVWQWRDFVVEPARERLLPDPLPAPYLQPKYTIVIELKNILVHPEWTYKTGYRFLKRPALDYFLDVIGYPNFEVVVYTSESAMTAIPVIDSIDPKQRIMFRLYRDCTKYTNGHHVKDLSKLNRDLSKVIFIEFDPKSGQLNPENMLRIPEWKGNMNDTTLVDLAELLKTIHLSDTDDVRDTIQYYSQFDDPAKEFRKRAMFLSQQEEEKKMHVDDDKSLLKRYSGRLFGARRHHAT